MTTPRSTSRTQNKDRIGIVHIPMETVLGIIDPSRTDGLHAITYTVYTFLLCDTFTQQGGETRKLHGQGNKSLEYRLSANGIPALCEQLSEQFRWPADRIAAALRILEKQGLIKLYARHIEMCEFCEHTSSETTAAHRMRDMRRNRRTQAAAPKASNIRQRTKAERVENQPPIAPPAASNPVTRPQAPSQNARNAGPSVQRPQAPASVRPAPRPQPPRPRAASSNASAKPAGAEGSTFSMKDLGF